MPTVGTPPRLSNYGEYEQLVGALLHAGAIESIRDIWWDIRPHPGFGTVEVRLMDAVPTVTEMVALAALTQCLVVDLAGKSERGEMAALLPEWVVAENKWRAVRRGLDADVITDYEGRQRSIRAEIVDLLDILAPVAADLNCGDMLDHLKKVVRDGHPGIRQVEQYEQSHDLKAVVKLAMEDLEGSV
jgi:carboxylate-amine ligase